MIITIKVDEAKLAEVQGLLAHVRGGMGKALAGAVNDTAKVVKTEISSDIRERVNIKKKDIDPHIVINPRATPRLPSAKIRLSRSERLSLKYFGARQTKKGVRYRISKSGGRSRIPSAFGPDIPRLGGHVYRRTGKPRLPIIQLKGPSPWGVFVKAGLADKTQNRATAILEKKLNDRVRYLLLKQSGAIP